MLLVQLFSPGSYRAFRQAEVNSRKAAWTSASEAPAEPNERTGWRTTTPSCVIDQSNRSSSFEERVTRSL